MTACVGVGRANQRRFVTLGSTVHVASSHVTKAGGPTAHNQRSGRARPSNRNPTPATHHALLCGVYVASIQSAVLICIPLLFNGNLQQEGEEEQGSHVTRRRGD